MSALLFRDAQPAVTTSPNRADVVCFIGFVARRPGASLPSRLKTWLQAEGWRPRGAAIADDDPLLHTPVPIDSLGAFEALFAWETRPPQPHAFPFTTWLGAAVRSFFRQGGSRCFVVRVGDPVPYNVLPENAPAAARTAHATARAQQRGQLLPGLPGSTLPPPSRQDRTTWQGLGVMLGLDEAAFFCLPDLPELVADAVTEPAGLAPLPSSPETFVDCTPEVKLPPDETRQISAAPACTDAGLLEWRRFVREAAHLLRRERRDAQLLLAVPRPARDTTALTRELESSTNPLGLGRSIDEPDGTATAFLQLCQPWVATAGAEALPGGTEPPDGVFAGVLARAIPEIGVAHSIGRRPVAGVHGLAPEIPAEDLRLETPRGQPASLIHRVSLLGRTPDGLRILSDVTTSLAPAHRPACIGRLTAALLRTARQIGDAVTFEPADREVRERLRGQLDRLLNDFYAAGALRGLTAAEAYSVVCDDTTISAHDHDHGRVIAEVRFTPVHPVGQIIVILSLREGAVTAVEALA